MSRAGSTKGKYIIIVSAPVIDENNNFNGVLAAAILVSDLVDFHLNDIKVLDSSNLYLISSSGEVIYSDQQNLLGQNFEQIFADDFLGKKKVLDIISTELKSDSESKIKIAIPSDTDNTKLTPYLISASPVNLNGDNWKVVISVPEKDLNIFTYNFFNKQIFVVFIVVTLFILVTLRASRNSGYQEAVVDEHKIHDIKPN